MFVLWNAPQACLWIASQDNAAVSSLPENYTFTVLAFHVELELIDSDDDHAVVIDEGMTIGQVLELRDQIAEALGPSKADTPGTAWIGGAQKELLAACANGALKMTGRPLHGGPSREIPADAFATFRFFERDGVDCLGPPDLVEADCWRDLRVQSEHVRQVWRADGPADAASSASVPTTSQPSPADGELAEKLGPKTDTKHASAPHLASTPSAPPLPLPASMPDQTLPPETEAGLDPSVWLVQEIGRRRKAKPPEPTDRESMSIALGDEFPELDKYAKRDLIKGMPQSLKGKGGRKKGTTNRKKPD